MYYRLLQTAETANNISMMGALYTGPTLFERDSPLFLTLLSLSQWEASDESLEGQSTPGH